jgi:hypothetical protein
LFPCASPRSALSAVVVARFLFHTRKVPMYQVVSELLGRLDADDRERFEERAAIVEYEGGLPREEAESYALLDVLQSHPFALTGVTLIQIDGENETRWLLTTDAEQAKKVSRACGTAARLVDLTDVIKEQFGGAALLTPVPECAK